MQTFCRSSFFLHISRPVLKLAFCCQTSKSTESKNQNGKTTNKAYLQEKRVEKLSLNEGRKKLHRSKNRYNILELLGFSFNLNGYNSYEIADCVPFLPFEVDTAAAENFENKALN